jgi:hypothetical protein
MCSHKYAGVRRCKSNTFGSILVETVTFVLRIRDVLVSNLDSKTCSHDRFILFLPIPSSHMPRFVCLFLTQQPLQWARASSFTRFLDHTQRRTTVGRTPLDE